MDGKAPKKIVILGAGFAGLETATGLAAAMTDGYEITLIDRSSSFFIGFSKIDVLFGRRTEEQVRYRYENLRAERVRFVQDAITKIDTDNRTVATERANFRYDYLVVALGASLDRTAITGFVESGGHEFYSMEGARRLRPVIEAFTGGTLVIGIFDSPYKCPPAPYEVAYQLHDLFVSRGLRDAITMRIVIPTARPVPNPTVSETLERLLAECNIDLVPNSTITAIDAASREVLAGDVRLAYDLFVGVPVHIPPPVVAASKLVDGGFVRPSPLNLETAIPDVYAIGDVTEIPVGDKTVPKAGAFAEDAAHTVVSDILLKEGLVDSRIAFKARGACYFELGRGAVAKVDADYFGGEKPKIALEGPSPELRDDKLRFEQSRRDRWFSTTAT